MSKRSVILLVLIVLGAALRIRGGYNNLWLDEIWALNASQTLKNPFELYSTPGFDGHSSLYTVLMYYMGFGHRDFTYRIPAIAAGLVTLLLVPFAVSGRRGERSRVFFAMVLVSLSFVLVLYESEARGYSVMLFFMTVTYIFISRFHRNGRLGAAFMVWATSIGAFLFHYSFIQTFVAYILWSLLELCREKRVAGMRKLVLLYGVPATVFALIYLTVIRFFPPGSATVMAYGDVIVNAISLTVGGPYLTITNIDGGDIAFLLAVAVIAICFIEIYFLWQENDSRWLLYFGAIFFVPTVFIVALQPKILAVRYFLGSIVFTYFLLAGFLTRMWKKRPLVKLFIVAMLAMYIGANAMYLARFVHHGRGEYKAALIFIATQTDGPVITIGSDHDFRNGTMVDYYAPKVIPERTVRYVSSEAETQPPEWYITHSEDPSFEPPATVQAYAESYHLEGSFYYTVLSGWNWFVYRKVG